VARRRPRAVAVLGALLGLALYLAPPAFWTRIKGLRKVTSVQTIGEMDPEGSARQRFEVLQTAVRIIQDHPVLGVGLGAYELANARYNPALGTLDTHNTYLHILAETGWPGLVLFLALVASVVSAVRDVRRRAARVLPAQAETLRWLQYALVGHLIAAVFGSFAAFILPYIYLALLWSASQAVRAQCASAPPAQPPVPPANLATGVAPRRLWSA